MFNIPEVTFKVSENPYGYGAKLIVMTDEVVSFAKAIKPKFDAAYQKAQKHVSLSLMHSTGEGSWRRNNGPDNCIQADILGRLNAQIDLLASGKNQSEGWSGIGHISERDWKLITLYLDDLINQNLKN